MIRWGGMGITRFLFKYEACWYKSSNAMVVDYETLLWNVFNVWNAHNGPGCGYGYREYIDKQSLIYMRRHEKWMIINTR